MLPQKCASVKAKGEARVGDLNLKLNILLVCLYPKFVHKVSLLIEKKVNSEEHPKKVNDKSFLLVHGILPLGIIHLIVTQNFPKN